MSRPTLPTLACLLALSLSQATGFEGDDSLVPIAAPDDPVVHMELVEVLTEEVADWLIDFSDLVRKRQIEEASTWLAEGFQGQPLAGLAELESAKLTMDVLQTTWDAKHAPVTGRDVWMEKLNEIVSPWQRIERVRFKVKAADFQKGRRPWGKVKLAVSLQGEDAERNPLVVAGKAYARVEKKRGQWSITHFALKELSTQVRQGGTFFENVTEAAGVAHQAPRFGTGGNTSYEWNGAGAADVDGDGDWDLFVPSNERNHLYIAQPDGTYTEEAEKRGVLGKGAGTGVVFFDMDNDGDQDLIVGQVSWLDGSERLAGNPMEVYRNKGEGTFELVTEMPGLETPMVAYHATVFDYDNDGWLDIFWACYGRLEVEHNNSWIEATNGKPNVLLRNLEGKGFEEVTAKAGIGGQSWTYAAAAADVNGDGWLDLYVANDYGTNRLWINQKDGTFTDQAKELGVGDTGNGMGVAFGDLSGQGALDIYVSNMSSTAGNRILDRLNSELDPEVFRKLKKMAAGNIIFRATKEGSFETVPPSAGGINGNWAWSVALNDFDLDGRLDVFCTNGFVTGETADDT